MTNGAGSEAPARRPGQDRRPSTISYTRSAASIIGILSRVTDAPVGTRMRPDTVRGTAARPGRGSRQPGQGEEA
ncbi:hypothetical protein GCM10010510_21160 [Streptomyces anandii JCM 4720]|nr:hypothetical protein GCM10010510_21160 [Streptomyces anandii JCM 4720]